MSAIGGGAAGARPRGMRLTMALVLLAALAGTGRAAAGPGESRLDPRLRAAAAGLGPASLRVWIEFADKGERDAGDLAARLAAAEAALTPEARARRVRAGVVPLVDVLDLPVAAEHLAALRAEGAVPEAQSRWFDAVVARVPAARLERVAALACVRAVRPEPLAAPRVREPEVEAAGASTPAPAREALRGIARGSAATGDGVTAGEMARLHVDALHDSAYVGTGVTIAVLDDGFNLYDLHEATRSLDVGDRTRDFVRGGSDVQDTVASHAVVYPYFQHGQWVLGVLGGHAPGRFGSPAYGARFALARTEDDSSEKPIEMVNWLVAAEWADSLGADIISSSLGYRTFQDSAGTDIPPAQLDGRHTIITRAAQVAAAKGILVVNSAGNSGSIGIDAPADANGDSVLAVGAVDSTGAVAAFSSRGPTADGRTKPDVSAQGVWVWTSSTIDTTRYVPVSGTSFACPLVSGVAACLMQARPNWRPVDVIRALRETASNAASPDNAVGKGVVDARAALGWRTGAGGGAPPLLRLDGAHPLRSDALPARFTVALVPGAVSTTASLRLFDVAGRRVRTVWWGLLSASPQAVAWDGTDERGRRLPSGLYFAVLDAAGHRTSRRLMLIH